MRARSKSSATGGYATAEIAVALPAVMIVVLLAVWLLACVGAQLRCVDAVRAAARAAARGDAVAQVVQVAHVRAPRDAQVEVDAGNPMVRVVVRAEVGPLGAGRAAPRSFGVGVSGAGARAGSGVRPGGTASFRRARAMALSRPGPGRDAGSGTVVMLLVSVVVLLAGLLLTTLGAVAVARQRAASAADLAALAGYAHLLEGQAVACQAAERVLTPVGATLVACDLVDGVVDLSAQVQPTGWLAGWGAATSRARAGAGLQLVGVPVGAGPPVVPRAP